MGLAMPFGLGYWFHSSEGPGRGQPQLRPDPMVQFPSLLLSKGFPMGASYRPLLDTDGVCSVGSCFAYGI